MKYHCGTTQPEPDNRVLSSYLPDGTLIACQFYSVRTRTVVRVNSKGDTIVRTIREPVIDRTLYRGSWEINGSVWRLNTPEGIATVVKNASTTDAGRTFTHLWYVRDRLGSVRTVLDDEGAIRQCTMFYPSGLPVQLFGTERVSDRAHIGNRWSGFAGLGWHDNTARWHDAILDRFTTPDPKSADYPSFSPYTHCAANPLRFTDPTGMWTVKVSASPDRGTHPYALYMVYDKNGNKLFQTVVRVKGQGRNRTVENSDTPQGDYKILEWRKTGPGTNYPTLSFDKNPLLALEYKSGEGYPKRVGMHTHGGRDQQPDLWSTNGCIRMADADIAKLKEITDALTLVDPTDKPETLTVKDDLGTPVSYKDVDEHRMFYMYLNEVVITPSNAVTRLLECVSNIVNSIISTITSGQNGTQ